MSSHRKPRHGRRELSREEINLWRAVTRDVKPLAEAPRRGQDAAEANGEEQPAPEGGRTHAVRPIVPPPGRPSPGGDQLADIDRKTLRRIKRGQTPVEAVLDLHGHSQAQAHRALDTFLAASQAAGRRCVLVITGKGVRGEGKIRRAIPHWLALGETAGRVVGVAPAQPRHGGEGALYIYLRRPGKRQ